MNNISEDIVRLLKINALSSYKIAQDTGISDQTIQNYRDGKTTPKGANLRILSKYLGIKENEMFVNAGTEEIKSVMPEAKDEANELELSVELNLCPECIQKKNEIEKWKSKFYALCEELNEVNRKYTELLEEKIDVKKETTTEDLASAV